MHLKTLILSFILLSNAVFLTSAQDVKAEKETHLDADEMPPSIIALMSQYLQKSKRVRYLRETDGNNESFEVKFFLDRVEYSVEFDTTYQLEDIEVTREREELPVSTFKMIDDSLKVFGRYKIKRIQQQFSSSNISDSEILQMVFMQQSGPTIRYELVISAKKGKVWEQFELLFDEQGKLLSQRRVKDSTVDYLLY